MLTIILTGEYEELVRKVMEISGNSPELIIEAALNASIFIGEAMMESFVTEIEKEMFHPERN